MTHRITVLLETMPAHLRDSHREARNWGEWPHNGSIRTRLPIEDAAERADADDEYDHLVPGSEIIDFEASTPVAEQVVALVSYSLEHDVVSCLRSPALADALQRICEGWRSDGRIWGGDERSGYWLIRLLDPSTSPSVCEELIELARVTKVDEPPVTERAPCEGCATSETCAVEDAFPPTLRDPTVPSQVDASERDIRALAEALIESSIRTCVTSRSEHSSALDLMLRGLANEWRLGTDSIFFTGRRDGKPWRVELTGICPF
jgi:hypothetical protein